LMRDAIEGSIEACAVQKLFRISHCGKAKNLAHLRFGTSEDIEGFSGRPGGLCAIWIDVS
jgi:hypothetical protein